MITDSHCHLDRLDLSKSDNSLQVALDDAEAKGVSRFLCVCISEENRQAVLDIAATRENVFASVGVHPCDVTDSAVSVEALTQWSQAPKVVALGESGLDYFHSTEHVAQQKQSFINHFQVGQQQKLPVIVHTRNAKDDTLAIMRDHACREASGVLHCFTEDWDMAKAAMDMNFYISISGIVTFKNAEDIREVVRKMPLEYLLVETDSPYLAPIPYRGKPNMPAYVRDVAQFVADLKGLTLEALADITTNNFLRLFNRAQ
ncbi:TatD family hydrolase [Marinagarivorans algicola]|uniref:TatD family hydrolase n=1 Tax=Marinagarivorans algicola TaxID=1513270 RepID=UPI0006B50568|nr:TatD family hydrolase [Marinagarivorans algicola]